MMRWLVAAAYAVGLFTIASGVYPFNHSRLHLFTLTLIHTRSHWFSLDATSAGAPNTFMW
jgi:hypothetical protein